jgi:hypothetical protein
MEALAWQFVLSTEREAEEARRRMLGSEASHAQARGRGRLHIRPDADAWVSDRADAEGEPAATRPSRASLLGLRRLLSVHRSG